MNYTYILQKEQYISELHLPLQEKYVYIIAPTGSGKTRWATESFEKFDMVFPTKMMVLQKSQQYGIHGVYEGQSITTDDKQYGTFDAIYKFTQRDCSDRTLIIDEIHHVVISAAYDYRKDTIDALIRAFSQYKQVIVLTGTPIQTCHPIFSQFTNITIKRENEDYRYDFVRTKDTLSSIEEHIIKGKMNFVLCNHKGRIEKYAQYFLAQGFSVGIITKDTLQDHLAQVIIEDQHIHQHYDIIFLTSVFTESIDIYDCELGTIQCITYDSPIMIKQLLSRFRNTHPQNILIYVPFYDKEGSEKMTLESLERGYIEKAGSQLEFFNKLAGHMMIRQEGIVQAIRKDLQSEFLHLYKRTDGKFEIDYIGISYYSYHEYVKYCYKHTSHLQKLFEEYHLRYSSHIHYTEDVRKSEKTKLYTEIRKKVRETEHQIFQSELNTYKTLEEKDLRKIQKKHCHAHNICMLLDEFSITYSTAIELYKKHGISTQQFHQLQRKLRVEQYIHSNLEDIEGTIDVIQTSFIRGERYTSEEIYTILRTIYSGSIFYKKQGKRLTETTAVRLLRDFFVLKRCKIQQTSGTQNGYIIQASHPLQDDIEWKE